MTSETAAATNAAQIDYWNAGSGESWAAFQSSLDTQLDPLGRAGIDALAPRAGERILDVGCGCGHTTLQLADRVGSDGAVTGLDVSRPMLEVARTRSLTEGIMRPAFIEADAQTSEFPAPFDAIFSRFGVMFFEDTVAAFANLRQALKPQGRFTFVCWRSPVENLWMRLPVDVAAPFLPPRPPFDPAAPGPYRFADATVTRGFLEAAGFEAIDIRPHDALVGGLQIDEALRMALRIGPLGSALRDAPEKTAEVTASVRTLLEAHRDSAGKVWMPAAVWIASARRPD